MTSKLVVVALAAAISTGCASITTGTSQSMKVETYTAQGQEVEGVICNMQNDHGSYQVSTPGSVSVHKSDSDLTIYCATPGHPVAKGIVSSRGNLAQAGNILAGGMIGAMIDHNRGSAYSYPAWVRLVMGRELVFDKETEVAGGPSPAVEVAPGTVYVKKDNTKIAPKESCSPQPQCASFN